MEDSSDPERTILMLCDDWSPVKDGIVGVNRSLALTLTRYTGVKVYSTVLKNESEVCDNDKRDATRDNLTLVYPGKGVMTSDGKTKYMALNEDPLAVYPDLASQVATPTHIVGHSPISAEAALKLRDNLFPTSKVILLYHVIPGDLDWLHDQLPYVVPTDTELVRFAEQADVIYSVTEKMHWYFTAKFRNRAQEEVDHRLFFPQCGENIFNVARKQALSDNPQVLTLVSGDGSSGWEGTDIATLCMSKVTDVSIEDTSTRKSASLLVAGVPQGQLTTLRDNLNNISSRSGLRLDVRPHDSESSLLEDLAKADICLMTSRAEPYGYIGLQALSAGIPTLVSADSAMATIIRRLTAEPEYFLVSVTPNITALRQDASVWRDRIMSLMNDYDEARERALQLRSALRRDESLKETHDNFVSYCLGGIRLKHEATSIELIDEKDIERELDKLRAFNKFLTQTLKQCWRMKHHPLARKDDYPLPAGADDKLDSLLKHVTNKIEEHDRRIVGIDQSSGSFIVYCPTTDALTDLWAMCDVINNALCGNLLGSDKDKILSYFGLKGVTVRTVISGPEFLQYKKVITQDA